MQTGRAGTMGPRCSAPPVLMGTLGRSQASPAPDPHNSVLPEMISRASKTQRASVVFQAEPEEQTVRPEMGALKVDSSY